MYFDRLYFIYMAGLDRRYIDQKGEDGMEVKQDFKRDLVGCRDRFNKEQVSGSTFSFREDDGVLFREAISHVRRSIGRDAEQETIVREVETLEKNAAEPQWSKVPKFSDVENALKNGYGHDGLLEFKSALDNLMMFLRNNKEINHVGGAGLYMSGFYSYVFNYYLEGDPTKPLEYKLPILFLNGSPDNEFLIMKVERGKMTFDAAISDKYIKHRWNQIKAEVPTQE